MKKRLVTYAIGVLTSAFVLVLLTLGIAYQIAPSWTLDLASKMQEATLCKNGNDIILNGNLSHKLNDIWAAVMKSSADSKQLRLFLNSPGGNNDVAESISNDVKKFDITTVLPANSQCFSACPLIFISAEKRIADPTALLGFHGPSRRVLTQSFSADDEHRVEAAMEKFPESSRRLAKNGVFKQPDIKTQPASTMQTYDSDFAVIQEIGPMPACNE